MHDIINWWFLLLSLGRSVEKPDREDELFEVPTLDWGKNARGVKLRDLSCWAWKLCIIQVAEQCQLFGLDIDKWFYGNCLRIKCWDKVIFLFMLRWRFLQLKISIRTLDMNYKPQCYTLMRAYELIRSLRNTYIFYQKKIYSQCMRFSPIWGLRRINIPEVIFMFTTERDKALHIWYILILF